MRMEVLEQQSEQQLQLCSLFIVITDHSERERENWGYSEAAQRNSLE